MALSSARGMRDFTPRQKERRDQVMGQIRETYLRHGFEEIETPAVEDHQALHSGLGGDNEKLSFQILKRGLGPEDFAAASSPSDLSDLGLRFDLTVPLARFYASHHSELPSVFRCFHQGPVWRAERPQKGRYRQFVQCDIDILGEGSSVAEIEVLLATGDALDRVGLVGYTFRLNDRRLLTELLTAAGVPAEHQAGALITLDKLDKIGSQGVLDELHERVPGGFAAELISGVLASVDRFSAGGSLDAQHMTALMGGSAKARGIVDELVSIVEQVQVLRGDTHIVFDPTLVRGMGYYTGPIVEISHPGLGISLGGGGRYDGMIGRFLGKDVPAFGVSLGFERLLEVLPEEIREHPDRVALVYDPERGVGSVMAVKKQLVDTGHTVRVVAMAKNMRPVFERLMMDGFARVATLTPEITHVEQLSWRELT